MARNALIPSHQTIIMGVNISQLVEANELEIEDLAGKKIAIDAFNWIYQFLSIIRQADGEPLKDSHGHVTSHLSGLFYRTTKLLESRIRPIYVFDGEPPHFKAEETAKRREIREEAHREWKAALERGDIIEARKQAQRAVTITEEILDDSKDLLEAMGIPVVQAPSEGEALAAMMVKNKDAFAVATQDFDSLLFGSPRLVRNLSITGKKRRGEGYITVKPEMIILDEVLKRLNITQNQLIIVGILVGTDYNPGGVPGYGPKKALELVKEKKTLNEVFSGLEWSFAAEPEEIYEFFKSPFPAEYEIRFGELDEKKVKHILCNKHDFSEERIESALKKIETAAGQKSLDKWFRK